MEASESPQIYKFLEENPALDLSESSLEPYVGSMEVFLLSSTEGSDLPFERLDRFVRYDGQEVKSLWSLRRAIRDALIGEGMVEVVVERSGREVVFALPRGEWRLVVAIRMLVREENR